MEYIASINVFLLPQGLICAFFASYLSSKKLEFTVILIACVLRIVNFKKFFIKSFLFSL